MGEGGKKEGWKEARLTSSQTSGLWSSCGSEASSRRHKSGKGAKATKAETSRGALKTFFLVSFVTLLINFVYLFLCLSIYLSIMFYRHEKRGRK